MSFGDATWGFAAVFRMLVAIVLGVTMSAWLTWGRQSQQADAQDKRTTSVYELEDTSEVATSHTDEPGCFYARTNFIRDLIEVRGR